MKAAFYDFKNKLIMNSIDLGSDVVPASLPMIMMFLSKEKMLSDYIIFYSNDFSFKALKTFNKVPPLTGEDYEIAIDALTIFEAESVL